MKHIPKKRFGQNFLNDPDIIRALVEAIRPMSDDLMVEIGPGLGALTQPLIKTLNHLHAVELDRDIIEWMNGHYPAGKITIHNIDALKFDFASLGERIRVVGNLPYNISTPILFHLLDNVDHIVDMHFMLQKEVVERMVAEPSTPEYGRLSVMLQYRLQMVYLLTVPPDAFDPPPKVESAFVRAVPFDVLPHPAKDEKVLSRVVTAAFAQRRKTLRNTLKGILDDAGFAALGIDPQLRAENLGVAEFVAIANHVA
ncbi:16S rRNA (adenine1518-N6/adenine1519-N6)-dimethyltransferase [Novimethylophilus kurashikiensis]|uniref:Ribosomal RNA small subunit methyltransferase A n=1 Tax=Novimethylophilus kurashikiensis TaxID=1825523 RepID=A0A2R5FDN8_9PROT|nr:16S rRNA (adenine(1518)-N(6)/adenine(1519)-N(6))-dimethyltransferase RsmA [Novimethylophilus kurashikiensis]GBG15598.1 16S rRNA (adenine1518-N6/adenine1519-N6)-dimethyltransferase [Novimethylophilus kurashikiensis]